MGIEDVDTLKDDSSTSSDTPAETPPTSEPYSDPKPETPDPDLAPQSPSAPAEESVPSAPVDSPVVAPDISSTEGAAEEVVAAREQFEEQHRNETDASRNARAEIESEYAEKRQKVERDFNSAIDDLRLGRDAQVVALDDERYAALEEAGLNPSGSDPRRYPENNPQGDFSK